MKKLLNKDKLKRPSATKRFKILSIDGFTCQYCGRKPPSVELEIDHIIPVSSGGSSEINNLITACQECNRGKRDYKLHDIIIEQRKIKLEEIADKEKNERMINYIMKQDALKARDLIRRRERLEEEIQIKNIQAHFSMKLAEYLNDMNIKYSHFAKLLDVTPAMITKYLKGSIPNYKMAKTINRTTDNLITMQDMGYN